MKFIGRSPGNGNAAVRKVAQRGFTLLELMISLALLALIVTIAMGAMRLGSRSMATGERKMESNERFRTAMTVMDAQVQSQIPLTHDQGGNKAYYFRGEAKTLRMATGYSIWGGRMGSVIVDYRVESDNAGRQTLYAVEQTPGMDEKREARLFTNASEISFEYFGRETTGDMGRWSDRWTDETTIPEGIGLRLASDRNRVVFRFPVRAQGDMALVLMAPVPATGASKR